MTQVMVLDKSYQELNVVNWQRALTLVVSNKAEVVEETSKIVRTVRMEFKVPAIIRLLTASVIKRREVKFSRVNILKRDDHTCQYCGKRYSGKELTLDHVIPKSLGGQMHWTNIVTACKPCNNKKANKTPAQAGMTLMRKPKQLRFVPYVTVEAELAEIWGRYLPHLRVKVVDRVE